MKSVPAFFVLLLASAGPLAAQQAFDGPVPGVDDDFQSSTTDIHVSWTFVTGHDSVDWRIGTTPGAGDVFSQTGLPTSPTNASATGLTLVPGRQYFVTVEALMGGTPMETATSDGIVVLEPLSASPASGPAPLTVTFKVPEYEGVVFYEWDYLEEGIEGLFDVQVTGTQGGAYSFTYPEPNKTYLPMLRLTHSTGSTFSIQLGEFGAPSVQVGAAAGPAPGGGLSAPVLAGAAPLTVTFTAQATTFDGTVVAYLWDFDGDGAFDFSSETGNTATHTYTAPGMYTPRATVMDARGATAVLTLPGTSFVDVAAPATPLPSLTGPTILTASPYRVGGPITFEAILDDNGGSGLTRLAWDFDGDGEPDLFDDALAGPYPLTRLAQWRPTKPGTGLKAVATLYNADNLSASASATYDVELQPALRRAWMAEPEAGRRVWGDFVTLLAGAVAPGVDLQVEFEFRDAQSSGPFLPISPAEQAGGPASPVVFPAGTERIGYHWDVTPLNPAAFPGGVEVQAVVTPLIPGTAAPAGPAFTSTSTVFVLDSDTSDPDVLVENHGSPFTALKLQAVSLTTSTTVSILQDTSWQFAPGTVATYEQMRLVRRSENPFPAETALQGMRFVPNRFRRDGFQTGQPLLKPAKLTVYLAPANQDVLADGTDLRTSRFMLFKFNPALSRWEPLVNQTYDASQKVAKALVTSGGDLALAVLDHGPSGGSSSSGCGLLGAEALPLAAVLLLRLRRRA